MTAMCSQNQGHCLLDQCWCCTGTLGDKPSKNHPQGPLLYNRQNVQECKDFSQELIPGAAPVLLAHDTHDKLPFWIESLAWMIREYPELTLMGGLEDPLQMLSRMPWQTQNLQDQI